MIGHYGRGRVCEKAKLVEHESFAEVRGLKRGDDHVRAKPKDVSKLSFVSKIVCKSCQPG